MYGRAQRKACCQAITGLIAEEHPLSHSWVPFGRRGSIPINEWRDETLDEGHYLAELQRQVLPLGSEVRSVDPVRVAAQVRESTGSLRDRLLRHAVTINIRGAHTA